MLDLVKYAFDHNVSIEISPISSIPKIVDIKVRRKHLQISHYANLDSFRDSDEVVEEVLDMAVAKLESQIRELELLKTMKCEVEYCE